MKKVALILMTLICICVTYNTVYADWRDVLYGNSKDVKYYTEQDLEELREKTDKYKPNQDIRDKPQSVAFYEWVIGGLNSLANYLFDVIKQVVITTPLELIANLSIADIYITFIPYALGLMVLIVLLYALHTSLTSDEPISMMLMIRNVFVSIIMMFLVPYIYPIAIKYTNILSQWILLLNSSSDLVIDFTPAGYHNIFISVLLPIIIMAVLIYFFLLILLDTGVRYVSVVRIFIMTPIALAISVTPKTRTYYYKWVESIKRLIMIQLGYAANMLFFSIVSTINFGNSENPGIIKLMVTIGAIYTLTRTPGGIDGLFNAQSAGYQQIRIPNPLKLFGGKKK